MPPKKAKRYWQRGAVKRKGALTRKAKRAGMSPMAYARKHYRDSGLTGEQSRYAVNAQKRTGKKRKSSRER